MKTIFSLLLTAILISVTWSALPAQEKEKPAEPPKTNAQDDDLLKDLTKDLFDGLDPPKKNKPTDPLDDKLQKQLGEGEDLGQKKNPLVDLGRRMREVETLLAEKKTGEPTQKIQQEIADEIAKLIEELKKQAQQQKQQANSRNQQNRDRTGSQPQKQPGQGQNAQNSRNPRDSTDRVTQGNVQDVNRKQALDLMKQTWGNLPPQLREAIHNVMPEDVLPKYETMIREYFERLSELDEEKR